jgi:nuclear GTP-binding protein
MNSYSEIPKDIEDENDPNAKQMAQSRRAFYKELKKVIDNADVVLQVLDARDPEGCRS